jgi:hypothetical protein
MNRDDQRDFLPDETLATRESEDAVALEKTRRMLGDPDFAAGLAKLKEGREAGADPLHWDPYAEQALRKAGESEKAEYVAPVAVPAAAEQAELGTEIKKVQLAAGIDPRRVPTQPKLPAANAPPAAGMSETSAPIVADSGATTSPASRRSGGVAPEAPTRSLEQSASSRVSALRWRRLGFFLLAVLAVVAPAALVVVLWVEPRPSAAPDAMGMGSASAAGLSTAAPSAPSAIPGSSATTHAPTPEPEPAPRSQEPDAGPATRPAPGPPRGAAPPWSRPKETPSRPSAPTQPSATPAPAPTADPAEPTEIF